MHAFINERGVILFSWKAAPQESIVLLVNYQPEGSMELAHTFLFGVLAVPLLAGTSFFFPFDNGLVI